MIKAYLQQMDQPWLVKWSCDVSSSSDIHFLCLQWLGVCVQQKDQSLNDKSKIMILNLTSCEWLILIYNITCIYKVPNRSPLSCVTTMKRMLLLFHRFFGLSKISILLIFCKLLLFFQNIKQELLIVYSNNFICVWQQPILFHFTLILLKLEHALITADSYHCRYLLVQSKPDKESHVAVQKIVLTRCCKWISFQSDEYSHYWWDSCDKNRLAQEAIFNFSFTEWQWQYIPTYLKISCWYDYYKSHVVLQSVNKIQATLQMMGQVITKKWFVKINLSW